MQLEKVEKHKLPFTDLNPEVVEEVEAVEEVKKVPEPAKAKVESIAEMFQPGSYLYPFHEEYTRCG